MKIFLDILQDPNNKPPWKNYLAPHQVKASYVSGTKTFLHKHLGI